MKTKVYIHLFFFLFLHCSIEAQDLIINVWPGKIPGAKTHPEYKEESELVNNGALRISKVTNPELLIYLPEKGNGTAVIICPGGGYSRLAMDHEGFQVARWLQEMGIVGIILKYRLPSDQIMSDKTTGPLQDAQEAVRMVRSRAAEWNIDPQKIGIMGFSAGGHLASTLSTHYDDKIYTPNVKVSARPDFSILIYPVITMKEGSTHNGSRNNLLGTPAAIATVDKYSNELQITTDTPPAFLVHSSDDAVVLSENSLLYYQALVRNKVPVEMHIYQTGGHGYGLGKGKGTPENWPESCKRWLQERGYLGSAQ